MDKTQIISELLNNPEHFKELDEEDKTIDAVRAMLQGFVNIKRTPGHLQRLSPEIIGYSYLYKVPVSLRDKIYYQGLCMLDGYGFVLAKDNGMLDVINPKIIDFCLDHSSYTGYLSMLRVLPEEYKTEDVCIRAILGHPLASEFVPKAMQTDEFYTKVMKAGGYGFYGRADLSNLSVDVVSEAIEKNEGSWLDFVEKKNIPKKFYDSERFCKALAIGQHVLGYIPKNKLTREMCEIHIQKWGCASTCKKYIPKEFYDEDMWILEMKQNPYGACQHIPDKFLNESSLKRAVAEGAYNTDTFPTEFKYLLTGEYKQEEKPKNIIQTVTEKVQKAMPEQNFSAVFGEQLSLV